MTKFKCLLFRKIEHNCWIIWSWISVFQEECFYSISRGTLQRLSPEALFNHSQCYRQGHQPTVPFFLILALSSLNRRGLVSFLPFYQVLFFATNNSCCTRQCTCWHQTPQEIVGIQLVCLVQPCQQPLATRGLPYTVPCCYRKSINSLLFIGRSSTQLGKKKPLMQCIFCIKMLLM